MLQLLTKTNRMSSSWCVMRWILAHQREFSFHRGRLKTCNLCQQVVARTFSASTAHDGSSTEAALQQQKAAEEKRKLKLAQKEAKRLARLQKEQEKAKEAKERTEIVYDRPTTPGDKKDIQCPLPAAYSPRYVEAVWYDWWTKEGFFNPDYMDKKGSGSFVMCLPPPNVTGTLHLGHALGNAIEDAIVRWHRMRGERVLWNPGCDHAGIATQVVVEKKIWREKGQARHDIGRKAFVDEVWKWKKEKGDHIYHQMKRLGSSLDWTRACFTLDPKLSTAVTEAFIRLHEEGLIYRGTRLVNWSCSLKSAISDIEVENMPLEGATHLSLPGYTEPVQFGILETFSYPIDNSDETLQISTTRLETMLGDTAVAVHPDDPRYKHLVGRSVLHPLCGRPLPVIMDDFVDPEFGTGVVKVTPAHDPRDHEVGHRHNLPSVDILDDQGCMVNVPDLYKGMKRFTARNVVRDELTDRGLYIGSQEHPMVLPVCSRSKDVVEPRLKEQWFVDCSQMAQVAIEAVKSGHLELIPSSYEKQWYDWLENIREWCISRQLWWGHRIPAYRVVTSQYKRELGWVSATSLEEATGKAVDRFGMDGSLITLEQDEDVLDTWFSSALFPFSIFGWPEQTEDLQQFYPTHLLETASDIMFFWVARMVMVGHKLTGQLPFKQVLFHSILRDAHGRKMSKSLGNIVDPMDVIHGISLEDLHQQLDRSNLDKAEIKQAKVAQKRDFPLGIPECGADALRFTLCSYNYKALYTNVDVSHMKSNRHFCNKIWQAFRYVTSTLGEDMKQYQQFQLNSHESATDLWILSRLATMVEICDTAFKTYDLMKATQAIRNFIWAEFCDVYLEYSKKAIHDGCPEHQQTVKTILHLCLDTSLRSLSPFMPFLTEELYQRLVDGQTTAPPSVCVANYPSPHQYPWQSAKADSDMEVVMSVIKQLLSIRRDLGLTKSKQNVHIESSDKSELGALSGHHLTLQALSRSSEIHYVYNDQDQLPPKDGWVKVEMESGMKLHIQIKDSLDMTEVQATLLKRLNKLRKEQMKLMKQTTHADETAAGVIAEKVASTKSEVERIQRTLEMLNVVDD